MTAPDDRHDPRCPQSLKSPWRGLPTHPCECVKISAKVLRDDADKARAIREAQESLTLRNGDTLVRRTVIEDDRVIEQSEHVEHAPLGSWNRCQVIVASGQDAPRTWRCWWPLPCPHHPHEVERVAATVKVTRGILDSC